MASSSSLRRIGILTGGGDCPGLNAVIRAVTKAAILRYGWEVWGIEDGFLGLIRNRMHRLSMADVSNILTRGGTILGTSNKADPSRFAVGTAPDGKPVFEDVTNRVVEHVAERGLDAVVVIGGDGTMSGTARLIQHGVHCVGVPKTIDNDLMSTELTFGFLTAVETATEALDRIHTTASSHHRVMLVEIMGRNAGWLTLHSGMASGADVILIPEIPYDLNVVCDYCLRRSREGKSFTIIAVSEGARARGGKPVVDRVVHDSPDPIRLGGVSEVLCEQIAQRTHLETRATILGHVQRGGTPCAADRVLATEFGLAATRLLAEGRLNRLVAMCNGRITDVEIADVADKQRTVPPDHPLLDAARAIGLCLGE
ncbi:MAG: 6-phosphofructokinase [Phycisphaerae bacterium]|nr:6-phosphofructokinase [Phycisphaerae bacterium]